VRRKLLLALGSFALTLIVLEVFLARTAPSVGVAATGEQVRSVLDPSSEERARWSTRLERVRARSGQAPARLHSYSQRYGWWNPPGVAGEQRGHAVQVNEVGARGARALTAAPPPGAARVVCYGESFTFGTEVGDDEAWPARLEVHAEGGYEVWNLAVGGWGTDQALLRARDTLAELDPEVALLGLLSENIGRNVNRVRNAYWPGTDLPMVKPRFVLEEGALRLLALPYANEAAVLEAALDGSLGFDLAPYEYWAPTDTVLGSHVLGALARRRVRRRSWYDLWGQDTEPRRVTVALCAAFCSEARAAGARFAGVVLFPAKGEVDYGDQDNAREALARGGVPVLDTSPVVRSLGDGAYSTDHFTARTNDEVAAAVGAWLAEQL